MSAHPSRAPVPFSRLLAQQPRALPYRGLRPYLQILVSDQISFCDERDVIAGHRLPGLLRVLTAFLSLLLAGSACSGRRFSQMTGARSYMRYNWKTACSLSLASIIRSTHSRSPGARRHQPAPSASSNSVGSASQRRACARFSITVDAPGRGDDRCCFGLIPFLCQIALMRGIRVVKGSDDGWHGGSQLLLSKGVPRQNLHKSNRDDSRTGEVFNCSSRRV